MAIPSGSSYSPYSGGYGGGQMSAQDADQGLEAAEAKKTRRWCKKTHLRVQKTKIPRVSRQHPTNSTFNSFNLQKPSCGPGGEGFLSKHGDKPPQR